MTTPGMDPHTSTNWQLANFGTGNDESELATERPGFPKEGGSAELEVSNS